VPQVREIREKLTEPLLFQHWDELTHSGRSGSKATAAMCAA